MKVFFLIILMITIFLYFQNNLLTVSRYEYSSPRLPSGFDKFRIVHLSDLHCKEFGKDNQILLSAIGKLEPDLICITGDLINHYTHDMISIFTLIIRLRELAPVYYVTGNHEVTNVNFALLEQELVKKDIKVLRNSIEKFVYNGNFINLMGVDDPIVTSRAENDYARECLNKELKQLNKQSDDSIFKILLSHRTEHFSLYVEHNIDLIFTGHAHGGQVRLPFIGGLVAPAQGYFPKLTKGKYHNGNSTMVVSSGLGNASIPQRINNYPEIVLLVLKAES